jgi:hypothetical protein
MMGTYILILMMHVGPLGSGNSNALTTAEFYGKEVCEAAGKEASKLASGTVKEIKYVCVKK